MLGLGYRRLKFNQPSPAHSLMQFRLQATKFDPSSWRITMDNGRLRVGGVAGLVLAILAASLLRLAAGSHPDVPALMNFKRALTDPKKFLDSWNASDDTPCKWNGIKCSTNISATELRRVLNISLSGSSLSGQIASGLGNLTKLDSLILSNNSLSGPIPGDLFNALTLTGLYLSGNVLTGQIPAEIFQVNMTLRVLDVSGNNITGSIPQGMGTKMTSLERLDLAQNLFTGSIPDDFGNLTKLEEPLLNLSHNLLSGAIPSSLANLKVALDVSYNNLSGPIPLNSYFNKQGPSAYSNNPFLCGLLLNISCTPPSSANSSTITTSTNSNKRSLEKSTIIGIAVGGAIVFSLMASLLLFFCLRKLRRRRSSKSTNPSLNAFQSPARCETGGGGSSRGCLCSWRDSGGGGSVTSDDDDQDEGDLVHLDGVLGFSLEELLRASAYVLGKSGVGIVYKAVLDDGVVVAVRRLGEGGANRCREFETEVRIVGQVRHPNVVTLHSYYWTADEKLLIYDFLPNGSLENALHGRIEPNSTKGPLTWQERLRIAKGAAHGLAHIHECSPRKHVHGDIKPSNILLDAFLEARIADFGLQRLLNLAGPEPFKQVDSRFRESGRRSSPRVAEMVAPFLLGVYQAPEAATAKKPNQKSDVYSFGVVLLELLTGRSPFTQLAAGELDLVTWMRVALQEKRPLAEIFDPYLVAAGNNDECKMIETLQVALACIAQSAESRPKMKQVAEFFDQLQPSS